MGGRHGGWGVGGGGGGYGGVDGLDSKHATSSSITKTKKMLYRTPAGKFKGAAPEMVRQFSNGGKHEATRRHKAV